MDNVSNAKITKILSNYHLRINRLFTDDSDSVALKCDRGWVFDDRHDVLIKRDCLQDLGYIMGLLQSKVRPCHCPACMKSHDWVHELPYLRKHITEICSAIGVSDYEWNEDGCYVAGYFTSNVYCDRKPVFIRWTATDAKHGHVQALVAMNNWDEANECEREPIKKRIVQSPSINSLHMALLAVRGDMRTPIAYSAEDMDSEASINLAQTCASSFAATYIHRDANGGGALNRRDERVIRESGVWWAQLFEPDDAMRFLKSEQASHQVEVSAMNDRRFGRFGEITKKGDSV